MREVVSLRVPAESYAGFARLYFNFFVSFGRGLLDRNDPMDKGPEYRSLVGLPGGITSPLYPEFEKAASTKKDASGCSHRHIWATGGRLRRGPGTEPRKSEIFGVLLGRPMWLKYSK